MGIQLSEIAQLLKTSFKKPVSNLPVEAHIEAGMKWLSRAQDATPDGGVSIRFSLVRGWESTYPETTGYIIPTFLNYYRITGDTSYKRRAMRMAEWELSIQQEDGSFLGGAMSQRTNSLVFDTGQIVLGLMAAFKYSDEDRFLKAARKAGDWLVRVQDIDGAWRRFSYHSIPHSYHSRVSWALVELYQVIRKKKYLDTAKKNIGWVLSNQRPNGWFQDAGFTLEDHKAPYTHTIAYTIRGILEVGMLLNEQQYVEAAQKSVDELLKLQNSNGFFWGRYDANWNRKRRFSCLTGNAQISIAYLRLYEVNSDSKYLQRAHVLNEALKSMQNITTNKENIQGAMPGSHPVWGEYERFSYPNWATKFFVDALMLEKDSKKREEESLQFLTPT